MLKVRKSYISETASRKTGQNVMTNVTSAPDTRHCNHTAGSCIVKLSNERGGIMEQSVIEIKNLVKRYKDLLALDH